MLHAILAAASVLGAIPLSTNDPAHQALVVRVYGQVLVRFDADGFVQARTCDGTLRHVGNIATPVAVRFGPDGALGDFTFDPALRPDQRRAFQDIIKAVGMSDWQSVGESCLPADGVREAKSEKGSPGGDQ